MAGNRQYVSRYSRGAVSKRRGNGAQLFHKYGVRNLPGGKVEDSPSWEGSQMYQRSLPGMDGRRRGQQWK